MNLFQMMQDFAHQLRHDAAIDSFCQSKWLKGLTVHVGQTQEAPASVDDCPLIIIVPGGRGSSEDGHVKNRGLRLGINIKADNKLALHADGYHYVPGLLTLDQITDLVEQFITNYRELSGIAIVTTPQPGPDDQIDNDIFKAWLALGVQLDSNYQ